MFNFVNRNPFGQKIESAVSTGGESKHQNQNNNQEEERNLLDEDDNDEVSISGRPILTEEDILYLTKEYIEKLKSEHEDNPKIIKKLDDFSNKFNVKKFMKNNPDMTASDFHMVMYNETASLVN